MAKFCLVIWRAPHEIRTLFQVRSIVLFWYWAKHCLAVLSGMSAFSWEKYTAALEAKGYKVKLKMDASVTVRGYTIQSGNSVYKSSVIGRDLTPSRIQETWEKMRPENRYGQMTPSERVAFALSDEGKNYLFPWGFTIDGKRYEKMVPGRVARVFAEESRLTEQSYSREETSQIFRTAFLLFAGYVDAATTFAQNCGGVSIQPLKWFSINFAYTRFAVYGGFAIDIDALAFRH